MTELVQRRPVSAEFLLVLVYAAAVVADGSGGNLYAVLVRAPWMLVRLSLFVLLLLSLVRRGHGAAPAIGLAAGQALSALTIDPIVRDALNVAPLPGSLLLASLCSAALAVIVAREQGLGHDPEDDRRRGIAAFAAILLCAAGPFCVHQLVSAVAGLIHRA